MKISLILLLGFIFSVKNISAQQREKKPTWDCQYILHKDSLNKIALDNMKGIGSIKFDLDSAISILGVCNTGTAKIKFGKDSTLKISDISKTMLWCDQKNKENEFLKYLSQSTAYEINKTGLKLYLNNKKEYLFFVGR